MKCPYILNTQTIIQTKVEQDEEGENKHFFEVQNQRSEMIECIKNQCAAYINGKCNYNGNN